MSKKSRDHYVISGQLIFYFLEFYNWKIHLTIHILSILVMLYTIQSYAAVCVVSQSGVVEQINILHMHLIFIKHVIGFGL